MESDEEDTGSTHKMPVIQGLDKRVLEEVIPKMISTWALPPGVKPVDAPVNPQLDPWVFFREILKNPRHIMAPMVDGSDLSYRLLARRYNTHVTFTPMIHSKLFIKSKKNQKYHMRFDPSDRPLIVQFGGATLEELLPASLIAQEYEIDAIDINMGCPQTCARQGNYGAYLLENPNEAFRIVRTLSQCLKKPVTVKMRIFDDIEKTIDLAKNIEACGASMITVHGRTKEQKGSKSGPCNWDAIKRIKQALKIPVVSNGGLQQFSDIERCFAYTGADAVMSADAMLWNPAFFAGVTPDPCDLIIEYISVYRNHQERTRKLMFPSVEILRETFDLCPEFRKKYHLHLEFDRMIEIFQELKVVAAQRRRELAENAVQAGSTTSAASEALPEVAAFAQEASKEDKGIPQVSIQDAAPCSTVPMDIDGSQSHKRDLSEMARTDTVESAEDHVAKKAKIEPGQ